MNREITEPNDGDYLIELYNKRTKNTEEISDEIRQRIERTMPFLEIDFMQVVTDMLGDLMDSGHPIEIKIFGNDHEKVQEL